MEFKNKFQIRIKILMDNHNILFNQSDNEEFFVKNFYRLFSEKYINKLILDKSRANIDG